jgi:hypothetical protein
MGKRVRRSALLLAGLLALVPLSGQTEAAAKPACVARSAESLAAVACAGIRPVPSLQPAATKRLWRKLVRTRPARMRRLRTLQASADCRPLRAVFYAASDWLRLATKLAANASPCAQYYISIPPLAADKTKFRTDQAWRIRALGPSFHALAEVHVGGWRAWVKANNSTWYQAGVEARRRMAAAGFSVSLGDSWIVNEFSSAVRRGLGTARAEAREFVHGLYDGDGTSPATKGGVFDIGIGQGALDLSVYKSQLEDWLQDDAFWSDMSRYVSDWSQELYGDPRNYAVAGALPATRRDYLNDYLEHQLAHAKVGPDSVSAARAFLETADSPLANAAWQWDYGFGWTMISADQMKDFISAQTYALRHFSETSDRPRDHWGFAWAPRNASALPAADFTSQTGEIIDRLAAAIHDSGQPLDPSDPGVGACGPLGQNLWCGAEIAGAWFNARWKTFTFWGQLAATLSVSPSSASLPAGAQQVFTASAADAYGNSVSTAAATWSVQPATLGTLSPVSGSSTTFTAAAPGSGSVVVTVGGISASAPVTVAAGAPLSNPPNQRPWIRSARFRAAHRSESIRLLACDDSQGQLLARVEQTLRRKGRVAARTVFMRSLGRTSAGCHSYRLGWRLRGKFLGRGTYTVKLRLRDSSGAWSKSVQHSRVRP